MNAVKISIIIPFYNEESLLPRCINSILDSSFLDYEIILINDGSTDNSAFVVEKFVNHHDNIFLINKFNTGVSESRNIGITHAKGDYITFVDADDTINDDYLSQLYSKSIVNGELLDIIVCGFTYNYSYANKRKINIFYKDKFEGRISDLDLIRLEESRVLNTVCNKLIRTEIIKSNNIFYDTKLSAGEDTLFIYKCMLSSKTISVFPYCGYNYWITGEGLYQRIHPFKMYESYINQLFTIKLQLLNNLNFSDEKNNNYLSYLCVNKINDYCSYMTVSLQKRMAYKVFVDHCKNFLVFLENCNCNMDYAHLSPKVNFMIKKNFIVLFILWKLESLYNYIKKSVKKLIIKIISI
ncbi:glycosyltransferase family 2 protein [Flavobacterium sp. TSSA_36]|uniref:glycosyltransferase family 2 protein n=1 Tax=Flavobacterium sp. TSSA_36 TaxID=3447669 RepID=UPI003F3E67F1